MHSIADYRNHRNKFSKVAEVTKLQVVIGLVAATEDFPRDLA